MAKKLSELPVVVTPANADVFATTQDADGVTRQMTRAQIVQGGAAGAVVKTFFFNDGSLQSFSNQLIPNDDTIPQISEGIEIITLVCSGLTTGNILEIDWHVDFSSSGAGTSIMLPLFIDAIADAISVTANVPGISTGSVQSSSKTRFTITAASHTIRVRMGSVANVTVTINGQSTAARFGGAYSTYIAAKELLP